jgi:hypothetical protein
VNELSLYLEPSQLTVLTTSECTAHCAHCSVRSGPRRRDRMSREDLLTALADIEQRYPLRLVVFAGGEPTLLGDDLLEAIAWLDERSIASRVVTNASWATGPAAARAMIVSLREAGLQELNISADEFHLPFIPLKNVRWAWEASKNKQFVSVAIALASGPGSRLTPSDVWTALGEEPPLMYDPAGRRVPLPPPSADGTVYALANNDVYRIGRGRRLPLRHLRKDSRPEDIEIACPWAVRSAALSPKGHMVACCGIEAEDNEVLDFGDVRHETIEALVERANNDPLVGALAEFGPSYLLRRARERNPELRFRSDHVAMCEVCEDVVTNTAAVAALRADPTLAADVQAARVLRVLRPAAVVPGGPT